MPNPYSTDLRWRVVWMNLVHRTSTRKISRLLCLSERTVQRYLALFHRTGDVKTRARRNGPPKLLGDIEQVIILRLIIQNPGIYLREIQVKLQLVFGVRVGAATICRTLKFMGCTRQRMHHVAIQQSESMRAEFMAEISIYDPTMLLWIDESGFDNRNSVRKFGYSLRGMRPVDHRLLVRGTRYSAIPVMSATEIHDLYLAEGSVNGERFEYFVRTCLLPILLPYNGINPRSIVIMDNAAIHHVRPVVHLIQSTGAKLVFLPPYSPDLNPLEPVFGKVKQILKENDSIFQVCSSPRALLTMVFGMITTEDCNSFSRHCGYV